MKVTYGADTDTFSVIFKGSTAIAESDEDKPGAILDNDAQQDGSRRGRRQGIYGPEAREWTAARDHLCQARGGT